VIACTATTCITHCLPIRSLAVHHVSRLRFSQPYNWSDLQLLDWPARSYAPDIHITRVWYIGSDAARTCGNGHAAQVSVDNTSRENEMRLLGLNLAAAMFLNLAASAAVAQQNSDASVTSSTAVPRQGVARKITDRLSRRAACRQQAYERGLSGRMARRYTRLCVSGLPIPDPIRRAR
jgi:hypothetical protein